MDAWQQFDLPRLKWEVLPVDKKGKSAGASVFVIAPNLERALAAGKYWRRVCGFPRARTVIARRYFPERDLSISAWVRKTPTVGGHGHAAL